MSDRNSRHKKSNNMNIPQPQCAYPSALDIQTRFNDFDAFGHINNNAYMQYYDLGKEHFFNVLMDGMYSPRELSAVIVNINVQFFEPTLPHQPLRVLTGCCSVGDRSIHLDQRIVDPATGHVKTTATTILAGFDLDTQSSGPIRPQLRAALLASIHP